MNWRGTTFGEWLLLVFLLGMVLLNVALPFLGRGELWQIGAVAMLVALAADPALTIKSKLRAHQVALHPSLALSVAGGLPIVPRRGPTLRIGVGALVVGVLLAVTGQSLGTMVLLAGLLVAGFGCVTLMDLALGRNKLPALIFIPDGLRLETASITYLVRWDAMGVHPLSVQEPTLVCICVSEPARLVADAQIVSGDPLIERAKFARVIEDNLTWFGAPVTVSCPDYGLDALLLMRALHRYIDDPAAREELR